MGRFGEYIVIRQALTKQYNGEHRADSNLTTAQIQVAKSDISQ